MTLCSSCMHIMSSYFYSIFTFPYNKLLRWNNPDYYKSLILGSCIMCRSLILFIIHYTECTTVKDVDMDVWPGCSLKDFTCYLLLICVHDSSLSTLHRSCLAIYLHLWLVHFIWMVVDGDSNLSSVHAYESVYIDIWKILSCQLHIWNTIHSRCRISFSNF